MNIAYYKTPRLYYPQELCSGATIKLEGAPHHYLRNVMRKNAGDIIRVFNADDGEFAATLNTPHKKYVEAVISEQIRAPHIANEDKPQPCITLACPILPKDRMDIMIEKAVELGVSAIQPLIFEHSNVRKLKDERVEAQIIEAAEQCERLDMPKLHHLMSFDAFLRQNDAPVLAAIERNQAQPLLSVLNAKPMNDAQSMVYLMGPEGGFSTTEKSIMDANKSIYAVCLGVRILRAETAAFYGLSVIDALYGGRK